MYYLVSELPDLIPDLPQQFLDTIPATHNQALTNTHTETYCNAPLIINETLTELKCSDPFCPYSVARRVVAMLEVLGVKGIGDSTALDIVLKFNLTTPTMLFMYQPTDGYDLEGNLSTKGDGTLTPSMSMTRSVEFYNEIQQRKQMSLWEYVLLCKLPKIDRETCKKLFINYASLSDFQVDWERESIGLFERLLNIEGGLLIPQIVATLKLHWDEIQLPLENIVLAENKRMINITLSKISGKKAIELELKQRYKDYLSLDFGASVTKNTDYVVTADPTSSSNKLDKARKAGYKAIITDLDGIIDALDHVVGIS